LHDRDTGLVRFGFRDFDTDIGRWTAKDPILFAGGDTDLYGYCLNDPVNLLDPFGLEFSDILPGIRTAIVEGAKGGTYSVGEAAKAFSDIAMNGHPLAQTALGIAIVSEAAPLAGAVAISALPAATSAVLNLAPYSASIVDITYGFLTETAPPQGWGYLSSGAMFVYQQIKDFIADKNSGPCENK
jgi:RHS repeat-associated protein